jgi:hypothetical protein
MVSAVNHADEDRRIGQIEAKSKLATWRAVEGTVYEFELRSEPALVTAAELKQQDRRPDLMLRCWPRGFPSRALSFRPNCEASALPHADTLHFSALLWGHGNIAEFVPPDDIASPADRPNDRLSF